MWMTEKKYVQLKKELRSELHNDISKRLTWCYNEAQEYANNQVKFVLKENEEEQIRGVALRFLYELIEMPPNNFIEALVKKINNVQLEK